MIMKGSANTYLLAQRVRQSHPDINIFNISSANITNYFVNSTAPDLLGGFANAGRYPGSWTLPVCNMSTWGNPHWNWNYEGGKNWPDSHPPCLCGEGGKETANWAIAAGMEHFQTFYSKCQNDLQFVFKWPDGVQSVNLGFGKPIPRFF